MGAGFSTEQSLGLLVAALIGLLLGGVLNIAIIRLPRERNLGGWPRCTGCGQPLAVWQLIPIVGWFVQGGKARCCGRALRWIHPLVELITGATVAILYGRYGLSPLFFYLVFVSVVLIVTGAIDWLHRWIYTFVILGGALVALIGSPFVGPRHTILNALIGLLLAGVLFVLFFVAARILFSGHAAPFGLGDVYLAVFLGAAYGFSRLGSVLLAGMLLAGLFSVGVLAMRALKVATPTYISYGTFLCLGALGITLISRY
jgi:leader peptidase (prepilin peptidase)/N-methyltransferase